MQIPHESMIASIVSNLIRSMYESTSLMKVYIIVVHLS